MVPIDHSRLHARDWKGVPEDYLKIDNFLDQTKFHFTSWQHRLFLHNPLGIKLCEDFFGSTITNSDGIEVPVRELARRHIMQDLGRVPTLQDWVEGMTTGKVEKWMNNPNKRDLQFLKENYYEKTGKTNKTDKN